MGLGEEQVLKVFGAFGTAACRKWNRNLRNDDMEERRSFLSDQSVMLPPEIIGALFSKKNNTLFQRVYEFLSLSLNSRTAITNKHTKANHQR